VSVRRRRIAGTLVLRGLFASSGLPFLIGCAATTATRTPDAAVFTIRIEDRDAEAGRFVIYDVAGDGGLQVGAGPVAQEGLTDATVPLTAADLAEIRRAVEAAGWSRPDRSSGAGAGPRRLDVRLRMGGVTRRFEILADGRDFEPAVEDVLASLSAMSRRRFDPVLDALPRSR